MDFRRELNSSLKQYKYRRSQATGTFWNGQLHVIETRKEEYCGLTLELVSLGEKDPKS